MRTSSKHDDLRAGGSRTPLDGASWHTATLCLEAARLRPGQLVRLVSRDVFKLGVVLGVVQPGKVRVCPWQNSSRTWSSPKEEDVRLLVRVFPSALSARECGIVRRAQREVAARGEVSWNGGTLAVRKVEP